MNEDTILPVRSKFRIPSRSRKRLYFVQDETKNSLFFIKWIELVLIACLLCFCFALLVVNSANVTNARKLVLILSSLFTSGLVLIEIVYPYFKRHTSLIFQILSPSINLVVYGTVAVLLHQADDSHELMKTLLLLNGFSSILFFIDIMCKIIISTYLYQIARVKSMVDVAVTAFFPSPPPGQSRRKPQRTVSKSTPITHGGTFPIGKNQPPFLSIDRNQYGDESIDHDKSAQHRGIQTIQDGDCKAVGGHGNDFAPSSVVLMMARCRAINTTCRQEDKGTSTVPPFFLLEDRRKKSPWTCSTPNTSRKIDARKQASMSTPITYSGTFAVNKDLVPITLDGVTGTSPKSSPRNRKSGSSKSVSNSAHFRSDNFYVESKLLDQISEEKTSSESCSLAMSSHVFHSSGLLLPGSALEDVEYGPRGETPYDF